MTIQNTNRVESIDVLRGLVMIIMTLDHVRDYFHAYAHTDDPLNLATTGPLLFFTRWITHFCAPIFVFLSGTSIYLQSLRKSRPHLSVFLIKRGLWLIFLEIAIITLGWTFDPLYHVIILQVIWAIGISMVILGAAVHLPLAIIIFLGAFIVLFHNLLDIPEAVEGFRPGFWWDLFHSGHFASHALTDNHALLIAYPFVPWTGLMMLGYGLGKLFSPAVSSGERRKKLNVLGVSLILLFIFLRFLNIYGDPVPWSKQKNEIFTFLSFINVWKYPPSLLYICVTIGIALLALSGMEQMNNRFSRTVKVYGRVALFFYIIHVFFIHGASALVFTLSEKLTDTPQTGYSLSLVYLVWILVVMALFPVCRWYDRYKTSHREKWWLSYL